MPVEFTCIEDSRRMPQAPRPERCFTTSAESGSYTAGNLPRKYDRFPSSCAFVKNVAVDMSGRSTEGTDDRRKVSMPVGWPRFG